MSQPDEKLSPFEIKLPTRGTLLCITAAILLGLVLLFVETFNMTPSLLPGYPGDAFFPRWVLGFTVIFALIILIRGLFLAPDATALGFTLPTVSVHWLEFVSVFVLVLLYANLLEPVGFEITTVVFMTVLLVPRLRVRTTLLQAVLKSLVMSVTTMLLLYGAFGLFLKIPLELKFLPLYVY